ncbi:trans-aconitate 2-methyltransferase [Nocardiopsis sp. MG754419]|uniref:class I SAM-dependent methyltransferase n=1 Tax=Nocardiopsis sp. MG754419 TaxID=2259865 RepID=UPI001BA5159A|nr:class I SAM-dependent methyltransferase [Nocardiopsis sp. MG754419]MBR8745258.1 SAM-dependent methyltransferase [Nocardiopsis sp. MG754419]
MYEAGLAGVYDLVYRSRGKDYDKESAHLAEEILARRPEAASLLDVASGTGAHLEFLRRRFARVEGLERSEDMIGVARAKLPDVTMNQGDMRDFALEREFDAVVCLFCSVAYVSTFEELCATLSSFAGAVPRGGVVAIEPWVFPEDFTPGYVSSHLAREDGRAVARLSHSRREGRLVTMDVHYVEATNEDGITHFTDVHRLTLFSRQEYEEAFTLAGCTVEYLPPGRFDQGLFIGTRR